MIGLYGFWGSNRVILDGSMFTDHSVLRALLLLNKPLSEPWSLYAGQPGRFVKLVDHTAAYFTRTVGYVE